MGTYSWKPPQQGDVIIMVIGVSWIIFEVDVVEWCAKGTESTWVAKVVPGSVRRFSSYGKGLRFEESTLMEFPEMQWYVAIDFPNVFKAYERMTCV